MDAILLQSLHPEALAAILWEMEWNVTGVVLRVGMHTEGPLAILGHQRIFEVPSKVSIQTIDMNLDGAQIIADGDVLHAALLGDMAEKDRREIIQRKNEDVLHTDKFPTCRFEASYLEAENRLVGTLELHGIMAPCELPLVVSAKPIGFWAEGSRELDLRPFGIKPYRALLGAIKVAPSVTVSYSLAAKPALT